MPDKTRHRHAATRRSGGEHRNVVEGVDLRVGNVGHRVDQAVVQQGAVAFLHIGI